MPHEWGSYLLTFRYMFYFVLYLLTEPLLYFNFQSKAWVGVF